MALTTEELQAVKELKQQGYSMSKIMGFVAASRANQTSRISNELTSPTEDGEGRFSDIGEDLVEGVKGIGSDIKDRISNVQDAVRSAGEQSAPETALQAGGNLLGAVGDIAGRTVQTAGKMFTSQDEEDAIGELVSRGVEATGLPEKYDSLSDRQKRNVVGAFGAVEGGAVGVGGAAVNTTKNLVSTGVRSLDNAIDNFNKSNVTEAGSSGMSQSLRLGIAPEDLMQKVARVSKGKQAKFEERAGQSVGEYLVDRQIFGTPDQIIDKLVDRLNTSKGRVDTRLAEIKGTFKKPSVQTALNDLIERDAKVSTIEAPSPDSKRITALFKKNNEVGLTLSEINEVKRLYERNVRVDYLNPTNPNPDRLVRATNIDSSLRKLIEDEATKRGFGVVKQLNKETSLAKQLADDLGAEWSGQAGNNTISLTDWVLLAEAANSPTAAAAFGVKKTLGSRRVMSATARLMARNKGIKQELPDAQVTQPQPINSYRDFLERIK